MSQAERLADIDAADQGTLLPSELDIPQDPSGDGPGERALCERSFTSRGVHSSCGRSGCSIVVCRPAKCRVKVRNRARQGGLAIWPVRATRESKIADFGQSHSTRQPPQKPEISTKHSNNRNRPIIPDFDSGSGFPTVSAESENRINVRAVRVSYVYPSW